MWHRNTCNYLWQQISNLQTTNQKKTSNLANIIGLVYCSPSKENPHLNKLLKSQAPIPQYPVSDKGRSSTVCMETFMRKESIISLNGTPRPVCLASHVYLWAARPWLEGGCLALHNPENNMNHPPTTGVFVGQQAPNWYILTAFFLWNILCPVPHGEARLWDGHHRQAALPGWRFGLVLWVWDVERSWHCPCHSPLLPRGGKNPSVQAAPPQPLAYVRRWYSSNE